MSEKINLTELRATHDGMGATVRVNQDDLLALVEAVEAAHTLVRDFTNLDGSAFTARDELADRLERFEFGQDR